MRPCRFRGRSLVYNYTTQNAIALTGELGLFSYGTEFGTCTGL